MKSDLLWDRHIPLRCGIPQTAVDLTHQFPEEMLSSEQYTRQRPTGQSRKPEYESRLGRYISQRPGCG